MAPTTYTSRPRHRVGGSAVARSTRTHTRQRHTTPHARHSGASRAVFTGTAGRSSWTEKELISAKLNDSQLASLATRTQAYQDQLQSGNPTAQAGRDYLGQRKLLATAVKYRLGVVAEPLPGDELNLGRLVIPYLTLAGVRAVKYRCITDHGDSKCHDVGHPKYMQPLGQEQRLFNALAYFGGHDTIGVAEGELDAITATEHLEIPTFGVPGAVQWDKHGRFWNLVLRDFSTVIVFADGDPPGRQLATKIAADAGPGARIVHCPDGEDINSMVVAGNGDELVKKAGL